MSNKQISKDNREYWQKKLNRKFADKRSAIESIHIEEINSLARKNFPSFKKRLGIEQNLKIIKKLEEDYNNYFINFDKRLQEKKSKLEQIFKKLSNVCQDFEDTRKWDKSFPDFEREDNKAFNLLSKIEGYLESNCKEETRKAFYNSKKGQEIKNINDLEEQADDLLHSDMIGTEVLKAIQGIAKKSQIHLYIPTNSQLAIENDITK
jgi:uncharacterized protein YdiU (UPF0061 family)